MIAGIIVTGLIVIAGSVMMMGFRPQRINLRGRNISKTPTLIPNLCLNFVINHKGQPVNNATVKLMGYKKGAKHPEWSAIKIAEGKTKAYGDINFQLSYTKAADKHPIDGDTFFLEISNLPKPTGYFIANKLIYISDKKVLSAPYSYDFYKIETYPYGNYKPSHQTFETAEEPKEGTGQAEANQSGLVNTANQTNYILTVSKTYGQGNSGYAGKSFKTKQALVKYLSTQPAGQTAFVEIGPKGKTPSQQVLPDKNNRFYFTDTYPGKLNFRVTGPGVHQPLNATTGPAVKANEWGLLEVTLSYPPKQNNQSSPNIEEDSNNREQDPAESKAKRRNNRRRRKRIELE